MFHIGEREDELFGELAELVVQGELVHQRATVFAGHRPCAGLEQGLRHEDGDVFSDLGVVDAIDHPASQDDVVVETLHDERAHLFVCVKDRRHEIGDDVVVDLQCANLVFHTVAAQRPFLADHAQVRHRLFNNHRPRSVGAVGDAVDEVEVSVADLDDVDITGLDGLTARKHVESSRNAV